VPEYIRTLDSTGPEAWVPLAMTTAACYLLAKDNFVNPRCRYLLPLSTIYGALIFTTLLLIANARYHPAGRRTSNNHFIVALRNMSVYICLICGLSRVSVFIASAACNRDATSSIFGDGFTSAELLCFQEIGFVPVFRWNLLGWLDQLYRLGPTECLPPEAGDRFQCVRQRHKTSASSSQG
jgi:hypothetical protein